MEMTPEDEAQAELELAVQAREKELREIAEFQGEAPNAEGSECPHR